MSLLPTPGKSPAGNAGLGSLAGVKVAKTVATKAPTKAPAPKPGRKPAPKAPAAPADPYGVMASLQPALQALTDQQNQQTAAQNQQRQAIQQATNQFLQYVQGQPSVTGDYTQAAQTVGDLAKNAGQFMQQANPADAINSVLSRLNPAQAAEVAARLGNVFNGGAQTLDTTQGFIPGSLLAEQGAHAAAFQKSQLPNVALQGIQGLKQFGYNAGQQDQALAAKKADLLAQIPGLTQKAQATAANLATTQAYRNAELGLSQQRINASIGETNARLAQSNAQFNVRETQQQNQFIARQRAAAAKFNAQQKNTQGKIALPNASLSRAAGYLVDGAGRPIKDAKGNLQVLPGYKATPTGIVKVAAGKTASGSSIPSGYDVSKLIDQWKNGKPVNVRVQTGTKKDAQGNTIPVYGTTTKASGKLQYVAAYNRLRTMGIGDVQARQYLDTAYPKGSQGRGWLTNEERAALTHAGIQNYAGRFKAPDGTLHGYIGARQKAALAKAGLLPPGEDGVVRGKSVYYIDPNG